MGTLMLVKEYPCLTSAPYQGSPNASKICIRLLLLFDILYKCFVDLGFIKDSKLSASRLHMADDKPVKSP